MEDLFVPIELAIKLRENGFNEPCIKYIYRYNVANISQNQWFETTPSQAKDWGGEVSSLSVPMYSQVLDWILTKYDLNITCHKEFNGKWYYRIVNIEDYKDINSASIYENRTLCNYYGITEALKLIVVDPIKIHEEYMAIVSSKDYEKTFPFKFLYRKVNRMIIRNELQSVVKLTTFFMEQYKDDVSTLRTLLDVIKKVSDEPIIEPLMPKLISLIEEKIGKKIY